MARKFYKLTKWLQECAEDEVTLSFADIEDILGFELSPSAYGHAAYWHASETHMLPKAWEEAGYVRSRLDFRGRHVSLKRTVRRTASRSTEVVPVSTHAAMRQSSQVPTRRDRHREERCAARRIDKLCQGFETYVRAGETKYTGPSVHFHVKAVERFQALDSNILRATEDERFCELLYATLVAWGMHDMRNGPKMPGFVDFANGLRGCAADVDKLSQYRITTLTPEDTTYLIGELTALVSKLPGSRTGSKLVANTKLLHHLLPQLVPPVDRGNTGRFFGFKAHQFQASEQHIFEFIFTELAHIGRMMKSTLDRFCYSGFSSSPTKVIDNAIVGFVDKEGLRRE